MARPLKFTPKTIEAGCEAYFERCGIDELGTPTREDHSPATVSGLECALGTTRDLLCDYERKKGFSDTIKRAKQRIEAYNEHQLMSRRSNVTGVIFNLKNNFNWKDKTEIENKFDQEFEPIQIVLPDNGRDT